VASQPPAALTDTASLARVCWGSCTAAKGFLYPEQSSGSDYFVPTIAKRPNFGIAVSGGGYRAVTLALGYVRYVMCCVALLCWGHTSSVCCIGELERKSSPSRRIRLTTPHLADARHVFGGRCARGQPGH
jgi:hypothetical protein